MAASRSLYRGRERYLALRNAPVQARAQEKEGGKEEGGRRVIFCFLLHARVVYFSLVPFLSSPSVSRVFVYDLKESVTRSNTRILANSLRNRDG